MIITRRLLKLLFDKTKIRNVEFDRYLAEVSFSSPRRLATKGLQIPSLKMSWSCAVLIDSLKIMSYLIIMLNWWNLYIGTVVGFSVSSGRPPKLCFPAGYISLTDYHPFGEMNYLYGSRPCYAIACKLQVHKIRVN